MLRVKRAATAALLAALAACSGGDAPLGPSAAGDGPRATISDAAHGGNPGFYFLPPMVANPSYSGVFDPSQPAEVEICELVGAVCGPVLVTYTTTTGHGSERVRVTDGKYQVNWHGNQFNLDPAKFYRITVRVGSFVLGYADVDVVKNGKDEKNVDPSLYVAMKQNQTLPIKFRIEVGSVNPNTPPVAGDDAIDAIGNVTVPVSAPGLLANDTDADPGDVLTIVPGTFATVNGGTATLNADGSFTYLSAPGFTGSDSFTYTVTDGDDSDTGTVTVTIASRVWYVKNDAPAPGDGRDASPFAALSSAEAASLAGETIFILFGDGTIDGLDDGITLKASQSLIGQGVSSSITTTLNGETVTLLAAGTAPTIGRSAAGTTVQLATDNTIRGLGIASFDGAAVAGSAFGTLTMSEVAIGAAGGPGVDLDNGTAAVALTNLSSTGSSGTGANLQDVSGTFTAAGGSISGATGTGFRVWGAGGLVAYGGDVSSSAGRPVVVTNRTGGSVTFSGSISGTGQGILVRDNSGGSVVFSGPSVSLSTSGDEAVALANNGGSSVSFTGGALQAVSAGFPTFSAVGGGTVTVTGANNTLSSTNAAALRVVGADIGAAGLVFRSVSADGGTNGIVLNGTGALGGLVVTGSGAAPSGGVIRGMSGDGVSLNATNNLSLAGMEIRDNLGSGIAGVDVNDFVLALSLVTGNGDNAATDEAGVRFDGLTGVASISGSVVAGSIEDNVRVFNTSGALTLAISSSTIRENPTVSPGNDGLRIRSGGTAVMDVTVQGTTFHRNRTQGLNATTEGGGSIDLLVSGGAFTNNNLAMQLLHNSTGSFTFDVDGVPVITGHVSSPILVNRLATAGAASTFSGHIRNNAIGVVGTTNSGATAGPGIRVVNNGPAGAVTVAITNNVIREVANRGIDILARDGGNTINATITGNNIVHTSALSLEGVRIDAGAVSTDVVKVCADVSGNSITPVGATSAIRVRQRFLGTTFQLANYVGSPVNDAAVAAHLSVTNGGATAQADHGGAGFIGVAGCPQP